MGEFEFIEAIRRSFAGIGEGSWESSGGGSDGSGGSGGSVGAITGIGDDCAVLPLGCAAGSGNPDGRDLSDAESLVVTTDMLVEGVHFQRDTISARELGAKSLAVNLSDVAAMGARPVASFLSLALPAECQGEWAAEFMAGYRQLSEHHDVMLAGGDTTASKNGIAINVTAIGRTATKNLKFRSGAQVGDIVAVTGFLGESAAGLRDISDGCGDTFFASVHRNPVPQVAEGQWLGARPEVHSMMDLSDGLASDLLHILRASDVSAEIDLEAIPTPVEIDLAVAGGEDYKLLLTASSEHWGALSRDFQTRFGAPLHPIGHIVESPKIASKSTAEQAPRPQIFWLENGEKTEKNWRGFTHF